MALEDYAPAIEELRWYFTKAHAEIGFHAQGYESGSGGWDGERRLALHVRMGDERVLKAIGKMRIVEEARATLSFEHDAILRLAFTPPGAGRQSEGAIVAASGDAGAKLAKAVENKFAVHGVDDVSLFELEAHGRISFDEMCRTNGWDPDKKASEVGETVTSVRRWIVDQVSFMDDGSNSAKSEARKKRLERMVEEAQKYLLEPIKLFHAAWLVASEQAEARAAAEEARRRRQEEEAQASMTSEQLKEFWKRRAQNEAGIWPEDD